jgi:hypothetical protein
MSEEKLNLQKKLSQIQASLNAPKSQKNSFGNYYYRSLEDITGALKPYLEQHDIYFTMSDEIVMIGDRFYVKATAAIFDAEGNAISNSAFAREEQSKKGMDGSQITGSSSSYARKYALNGLLLIDDNKDADARKPEKEKKRERPKQAQQQGPPKQGHQGGNKATDQQRRKIWALANKVWPKDNNAAIKGLLKELCYDLKIPASTTDQTTREASRLIEKLESSVGFWEPDYNGSPDELGGD